MSLLFTLTGCSAMLDYLAETEMSDSQRYDKDVCEHGEPSPPTTRRRPGCVNDKTAQQNYDEFRQYNIERDRYLNRD